MAKPIKELFEEYKKNPSDNWITKYKQREINGSSLDQFNFTGSFYFIIDLFLP